MAKLTKFEQDYKIGYKDQEGNIVVQPKYDYGPDSFGIDTSKKEESPSGWSYSDDKEFACVSKGGYYGLINEKDEVVVSIEYEEVFQLFGDFFAARKNDKKNGWYFGVIDKDGNIIIPFDYKYITNEGKFIQCCKTAKSKNKYFFGHNVDSDNRRFEYSEQNDFTWFNSEGKAIYKGLVKGSDRNFDYLYIEKNGLIGIIDKSGKIISPCKYEDIHCIREDRFIVRLKSDDSWLFGVIDKEDCIIIPFEYKFISSVNGSFYECYKNCSYELEYYKYLNRSEYKYKNKTGEIWFNAKGNKICCDHIGKFLSDNLLGVKSNDKWGVFNQTCDLIVSPIYDDVACVNNHIIIVKDERLGIINMYGETLLSPIYKTIECVAIEDCIYSVIHDDLYSLSKQLIHAKYSRDIIFDSNDKNSKIFKKTISYRCSSSIFSKKDKYINIEAKHKFDFNNYFILKADHFYEIYTDEKGIISNSRFDDIKALTNIAFAVKNNNKWGVFRADRANLLYDCIYDRIIFEGGNVVLLEKDGLWGAKTLIHPSDSNFNLMLDIDVPILFKEICSLDFFELLYGVKKEEKDNFYLDEETGEFKERTIELYTIVDRKGKSFKKMGNFESDVLDRQCVIYNYNLDRILTSHNNKYGFISADGYIAIPFIYDEVLYREDKCFDVRIGDSWGVLDIWGKEIVRIQYSEKLPLKFSNIIVKNTNNNRLGVLSEDGSEKVISIYEHLMIKDDYIFFGYNGIETVSWIGNFFSKNIKYAKWGVIDHNGEIIIKPKYDCYIIKDGHIMAGRDGDMLCHNDNGWGSDYDGVYDLYTSSGEMLFGGLRRFIYNKENNVYALYFGGEWETYTEILNELNDIRAEEYRFKPEAGLWLFLDKNFKSIIRDEESNQIEFKKGSICKIDIKRHNNDKIFVYNIPLCVMAKGFSHFEKNIIIIRDRNLEEDEYYTGVKLSAIEISSGKQTPFYGGISVFDSNKMMFSENKKMGLRDFDRIIIPSEYLFFTKPVKGLFFAAKEINDANSCLELRSIEDDNFLLIAIENMSTKNLIEKAATGAFLINFDDNGSKIENMIVPKLEIFDKSFVEKISQEESNYNCRKFDKKYWFSADYRMDNYYLHVHEKKYVEPKFAEDLTDFMSGEIYDGDIDYNKLCL
jgi:hypothetical protein